MKQGYEEGVGGEEEEEDMMNEMLEECMNEVADEADPDYDPKAKDTRNPNYRS